MKIVARYEYPPIPIRSFDWCATTDDYEPGAPIGWGATEAEAIADLKEQIEDEAPTPSRRLPHLVDAVNSLADKGFAFKRIPQK